MYLVCTNGDVDFAVEFLEPTLEAAEKSVKTLFEDHSDQGAELVKIRYEGDTLYAVRRKPVVVPDEYEYVDNDGNAINEDGSEVVEGVVVEDPPYEYDPILWIVRQVSDGKRIDLASSKHYLLNSGSGNPFERDENLTIVGTE